MTSPPGSNAVGGAQLPFQELFYDRPAPRPHGRVGQRPQVRKKPSWPRSWANSSLLSLYSHRSARANLHLLGQPDTLPATAYRRARTSPPFATPAAAVTIGVDVKVILAPPCIFCIEKD